MLLLPTVDLIRRSLVLLLTGFALGSGSAAWAEDAVPGAAASALRRCTEADHAEGRERITLLKEGLRLAEIAVERDAEDAHAHFAVFCNLGKLVERQGVRLSTVRSVRRLQYEIDRTLELSPDYVEALEAKGRFLSRLPGWLGGDDREAATYLARAQALQVQELTPAVRVGGERETAQVVEVLTVDAGEAEL